MIYTINSNGNVVIDGVEYPFGPPTHRMNGHVRVDLSEDEVSEILAEWVFEYNRIQSEIQQQQSDSETTSEQ